MVSPGLGWEMIRFIQTSSVKAVTLGPCGSSWAGLSSNFLASICSSVIAPRCSSSLADTSSSNLSIKTTFTGNHLMPKKWGSATLSWPNLFLKYSIKRAPCKVADTKMIFRSGRVIASLRVIKRAKSISVDLSWISSSIM